MDKIASRMGRRSCGIRETAQSDTNTQTQIPRYVPCEAFRASSGISFTLFEPLSLSEGVPTGLSMLEMPFVRPEKQTPLSLIPARHHLDSRAAFSSDPCCCDDKPKGLTCWPDAKVVLTQMALPAAPNAASLHMSHVMSSHDASR